ncbi:MAG TPA: glycosyltransferase family 39 protein [Solirubrobacteraceae bacterium]|nr:glycosyltransferase family 39 protein [Solirubrobacteraceae bacterium]
MNLRAVGHLITVTANPRQRWRALARGERITLVVLTALIAAAVAVRLWFMIAYPAAFDGFADAGQYMLAAGFNIFRDAQRPAGYPFFLRLLDHLSQNLTFTIGVQHAMGIATGLLLYKSVRRTGAPPWLGLLPAAIVFFGGTGIFLEHSIMGDSLFVFLQAVAVYAAIRALYDDRLCWPLLVGVSLGLAFWDRTVALSSAILIPLVLLCAAPGSIRRRLLRALTIAALVTGLIAVYVGTQYYFTGYLGYERQSAWDLYGRVATFVDCSRFTPPRGTRFLCPTEPVNARRSQDYFQYGPSAPAPKRFVSPSTAPLYANAVLQKFSIAAIERQPLGYAAAIAHSLGRYVFPRAGEGFTPQNLRDTLLEEPNPNVVPVAAAVLYPNSLMYIRTSATHALATYEADTRIEGPLLIVMLIAAIVGPMFLTARTRWAAILFTLTALCSIVFASAGNGYDARYAYPTFGPLAAGAALGAWGICSFLAGAAARRRARGPVPAEG